MSDLIIYLSAKPPEEMEYASAAEEAILSLARAVFAAGGRLLVNAEDAVVGLVCLVAGEYERIERRRQARGLPEERLPAAVVVLGEALREGPEGEERRLLEEFGSLRHTSAAERPEWLARANAMIAIGQQDERDWQEFIRTGDQRPVLALSETGARLPRQISNRWDDRLRAIEGQLRAVEEQFRSWIEERHGTAPGTQNSEEPVLPEAKWPLWMQVIVGALLDDLDAEPPFTFQNR